MKRFHYLLLTSFFLLPMTIFSQAIIKNYEYLSFFNPAAAGQVDRFAVTGSHNYYDLTGHVMNTSFGGFEFDLPKINSGFVFNFDLIRDDRRNYAMVTSSEIRNLSLNLGYRYRFEIKEDFGLSIGAGVKHLRRNTYRKWTGFLSPGFVEEWEDQIWSMNAGLFVDWNHWGIGFSVNDLTEPSYRFTLFFLDYEEIVPRSYTFQVFHNLELTDNFTLRPQFYFGQFSTIGPNDQRFHFRQYFFTTEFLYGKKFYFSPGIRSMGSTLPNGYNTFSAALQIGGIIINRLQIGAGVEYYFGDSGFSEITVEGMLKYRLRK